MNPTLPTSARPLPRWLHFWAVVTAVWALAVVVLGSLVTSFQVGMADPIWPTQPWFLLTNGWQEPRAGFLIEHTHRFAAFGIGGCVTLLAVGLWWYEPRPATRWLGLLSLAAIFVGFGLFHMAMRAQLTSEAEQAAQVKAEDSSKPGPVAGAAPQAAPAEPVKVVLPRGPVGVMVIAFGVAGLVGLSSIATRTPNAMVRFLGVLAFAGVIVQGLLGGFRVKLNALFGTDLALVHGIFAQVLFSLLVAIALLPGRPKVWDLSVETARRKLHRAAMLLVAVMLSQLVWGAMVRHAPTPLAQRLHILTAFAVIAVAAWMLRGGLGTPEGRAVLGPGAWLLAVLLAAQVTLGVEAWMGKFGTGVLPELQVITKKEAAIRSLHALVGTGILATAVALAVRTWYGVTRSADGSMSGSRSSRMPRPAMAGHLGESS